jgi:hypothetical protein
MVDVAVVSVVSTALVAIAGVLVPAFLRRGDRRHELRILRETKHVEWRAEWWKRRELSYIETLQESETLAGALDGLRDTAKSSTDDGPLRQKIAAVLECEHSYNVDAYGSEEIAREWRGLVHSSHSNLRSASETLQLIASQIEERDFEHIRGWVLKERERVRETIRTVAATAGQQRYDLAARIRKELAEGPEGATS